MSTTESAFNALIQNEKDIATQLHALSAQLTPDGDHTNDLDIQAALNEVNRQLGLAVAAVNNAITGGIVPDPVDPPIPPPSEEWAPRAIVPESGKTWHVHANMTDGAGTKEDPIGLMSIGKLLNGADGRLGIGDVVQFAWGHYVTKDGWNPAVPAHIRGDVRPHSDPVKTAKLSVVANNAYRCIVTAWGIHEQSGNPARAFSIACSGASIGGFMVFSCAGGGFKIESRLNGDNAQIIDGCYIYDVVIRKCGLQGGESHTARNVTLRRIRAEMNGSGNGDHQMYLETREGTAPGEGLLLIDVMCEQGAHGYSIKLGSNNPVHYAQLIGCEFTGQFHLYYEGTFDADFCRMDGNANDAAFSVHANSKGTATIRNTVTTSGREFLYTDKSNPAEALLTLENVVGCLNTDDNVRGFSMAPESTVAWPIDEAKEFRWWMRGGSSNGLTAKGLYGRSSRRFIGGSSPMRGSGQLTETRRDELLAAAGHWGWQGRPVPAVGACDIGPYQYDASIEDLVYQQWLGTTGPGVAYPQSWPWAIRVHPADHSDGPWAPNP